MNQKAWGKHGNRSRIKNVVDEYIFLHCNAEFVIRYLTPTFVRAVAANGFTYRKTKVSLIYIIVLIKLGYSHITPVEVITFMYTQKHS
ncbi:hypothetical protein Nit79A3_3325 [Nitrosomonas sp. Is79A3]